jgi:hypothetical protein
MCGLESLLSPFSERSYIWIVGESRFVARGSKGICPISEKQLERHAELICRALLDSRESFTASSRFGIKDVVVTFDSRQ